jgi:hypothetical protein
LSIQDHNSISLNEKIAFDEAITLQFSSDVIGTYIYEIIGHFDVTVNGTVTTTESSSSLFLYFEIVPSLLEFSRAQSFHPRIDSSPLERPRHSQLIHVAFVAGGLFDGAKQIFASSWSHSIIESPIQFTLLWVCSTLPSEGNQPCDVDPTMMSFLERNPYVRLVYLRPVQVYIASLKQRFEVFSSHR